MVAVLEAAAVGGALPAPCSLLPARVGFVHSERTLAGGSLVPCHLRSG